MNYYKTSVINYFIYIHEAVLTPIGSNSTCYPGIVCDGTEKSFYDCKYDRSLALIDKGDLFAIITRCIGKISFLEIKSMN